MLVDSHTHLLRLEVEPEEAVREAAEAGVGAVVNIGTDVEDSQRGAELAAVLPNVYSTAGIHPHNAWSSTASRAATARSGRPGSAATTSASPATLPTGTARRPGFCASWTKRGSSSRPTRPT